MMRNEDLTDLKNHTISISPSSPTSRLQLTFYTYEKSLYTVDISKALNVSIKGKLATGSQVVTQKYNLEAVHAIALDAQGAPTSWGKFYKFELLPFNEKVEGDPTENIEDIETTQQELTYNLSINPVKSNDCATNGFVRGNQYVVTGTLSTSRLPANGMLDVNIAPATPYSPEIKFTFD